MLDWLAFVLKKKSSESYYHSFPEGKMAIRPRKDIQFTIKDG